MEKTEALGIVSGISLLSLLLIGLLSIPAWIPALLVLIIGTFLTGFDDVASQQLDRRYKEHQELEAIEEMAKAVEKHDFNATKKEILEAHPERQRLLIELETLGIDTDKYEYKNHKEIEKSLTKNQRKQLTELRSFLK